MAFSGGGLMNNVDGLGHYWRVLQQTDDGGVLWWRPYEQHGWTWALLEGVAADRRRWRSLVATL